MVRRTFGTIGYHAVGAIIDLTIQRRLRMGSVCPVVQTLALIQHKSMGVHGIIYMLLSSIRICPTFSDNNDDVDGNSFGVLSLCC